MDGEHLALSWAEPQASFDWPRHQGSQSVPIIHTAWGTVTCGNVKALETGILTGSSDLSVKSAGGRLGVWTAWAVTVCEQIVWY